MGLLSGNDPTILAARFRQLSKVLSINRPRNNIRGFSLQHYHKLVIFTRKITSDTL